MRSSELPFTGPATFLKAPYRPLLEPWTADVGFLGLPYDFAVGYRPGARFAPNALREASGRYAPGSEGYFDLETETYRLGGLSLVDAGDVDPAQLEYTETFRRITEAARTLRKRVRLPVFVGGDHSVSYPILKAYDDLEELYVVQLDAHLDFSDSRNGTQYSNSSPFRRAAEDVPGLKHITAIGLRGLRTNPEAYRAAKARGHTLVTAARVREDLSWVLDQLPQGQKVYLSFDVDVLDPSIMPGTSSPEVEGLTYAEALAVVRRTITRNELVGFDLVELAPNWDSSGLSSLVGARLLAEVLCDWCSGADLFGP
ncbi:Arginase/agmatinase/formiminoglutamase [Allomeiothermus silvanus DSM 9946]|uniref:Arginase/agmatinase/formiminoglutamase n=1 Tax=Allomeiothermus silvanus (strain ATCC 700542 / DSM 9946 / NBRC 106475 / NCIMB 13440 / VI-R2) TaxID=526227 RepID=D7BIH7_ALLS1|nr:agmatinase [Allomeiothermus silvanus]ADH64152.1 Arginase/agmatinase/formiminoglutamase [Allomeiothermus silvanus DSM 9946]